MQVISTIVGVGLIKYIASRNKADVPNDFLRVSIAEPFRFPNGWAAWSITGLLIAPVAIIVSSTVFSLLPQEMSNGRGTVDAVAGLVETVDPRIFINLLIVTGVFGDVLYNPWLCHTRPASGVGLQQTFHASWCKYTCENTQIRCVLALLSDPPRPMSPQD